MSAKTSPDGIQVERLPQSRSKYTIEVEAVERQTAEQLALLKLSQNISVEGFRPGKAPDEMIRQKVPADKLLEQTVRELVPVVMKRILDKHEVKPILPPSIEIASHDPLALATPREANEALLERANRLRKGGASVIVVAV
jgi:trigger factor